MGKGSFMGVKRPGHGAEHPPLLAPKSRMSIAIYLLPLWAFGLCYRAHFNFFLAIAKVAVTVLVDCKRLVAYKQISIFKILHKEMC
jgi:hypothetical protein